MTEVLPNKDIYKGNPKKVPFCIYISLNLRTMQTSQEEYIKHPTDIPNQFILEYTGGRRVLVEIDPDTGKETFIREL